MPYQPFRSQSSHSASYFRSHFDLVDPGVSVAPNQTPEDIVDLRKVLNACKAIVAEKAPVLFDCTQISEMRNGWDRIDEEVVQSLKEQAIKSPHAGGQVAWSSMAEMLKRSRQLFDLSMGQTPKIVNVDEAFGQRIFRDLGRSISEMAVGRRDGEAVRETQEMCVRFGLQSVRLAGEDQMSFRERSKYIQDATADLAKSCKIMGIEERDFGSGSVSVCIDPHMSKMTGGTGFSKDLGTLGVEIGVAPNNPKVCTDLIHEYVHKLDHSLGLKVRHMFADAHGIHGPIYSDDQTMFSNMAPEQQALLPLAKEGLEKIFSTLGDKKGASVDFEDAFHSAAHMLATKTLGTSWMLQAPKEHLQAWIDAIRSDNDALFRGLASRSTRMSSHAIGPHFLQKHQDLHGEQHPFLAMAQSQGIDQEKAIAAIGKVQSSVEKLATLVHPALPKGMTPSPFLKASIQESISMASTNDREICDVLSSSHELLARVVGRPSSAKEMSTAFMTPSRWSPLDAESLQKVNEGFMKMNQADGVHSTLDGPRLSSGNEIAVARTATPVFKAGQYASYAVLFLSGQTSKLPKRPAPNDA